MEHRQKKQKDEFIYGTHPIQEAFDSGKEIDKLLIQKGVRNEGIQAIIQKAKETETPFQFVPIEKMNRVTRKSHQGIIDNWRWCYP